MKLSAFDFQLPPKLIAQNPASPRDACRLMVINRQTRKIQDLHFYDLPSFLQKGDVIVFNDSKVIPARILFSWNEKKIELLLTEKQNENTWKAIGKPGKWLQPGINFNLREDLKVTVESIEKDGQRTLTFSKSGPALEKALEEIGITPLPPYIQNSTSKSEDYQTIYAKEKGSIAAPTAGLHFTKQLLARLQEKGVIIAFVTLHVGLGTFLPVKSIDVTHHTMHSETFRIDYKTATLLTKAMEEKRRIIAVGTTAVRVLETACDESKKIHALTSTTKKFIYPGYHWKCVNSLITNFHLPKSTLLLLTAAFGGKDLILEAYQQAVKKRYRFYSFGDAMVIL